MTSIEKRPVGPIALSEEARSVMVYRPHEVGLELHSVTCDVIVSHVGEHVGDLLCGGVVRARVEEKGAKGGTR